MSEDVITAEWTHEKWLRTPFHYAVVFMGDEDFYEPLCGWKELDELFCYEASRMYEVPTACPRCLAHPDWPMHLLGDVP